MTVDERKQAYRKNISQILKRTTPSASSFVLSDDQVRQTTDYITVRFWSSFYIDQVQV